jgi:hypothetical protein
VSNICLICALFLGLYIVNRVFRTGILALSTSVETFSEISLMFSDFSLRCFGRVVTFAPHPFVYGISDPGKHGS